MENNELDMLGALKFARHDFLNELQLILLYIDLDKKTEAREKILQSTENLRQLAMLERLRLPALESWLMTFPWRYNSFETTLSCDIIAGTRSVDDKEIVTYINRVMNEVEMAINPMNEYQVNLVVKATSEAWEITIKVTGVLTGKQSIPITNDHFYAEETTLNEQWTFTLSGR